MASATLLPSATGLIGESLAIFLGGRLLTGAFLPLFFGTTILQFAGPAFRVTLPACVLIAALRKKYEITQADILKMQKENELREKCAEILRDNQRSDRKMFGLYLLGLQVSYEVPSNMSTEDIESAILGINRDMLDRLRELKSSKASEIPPGFEYLIQYICHSCDCGKENIEMVFKLIMDYCETAGGDRELLSQLSLRFENALNSI